MVFVALLKFLAEFFQGLLPLDFIHDEEAVHLVLDALLVVPQLVQLQLRLHVAPLFEFVLTPDQIDGGIHNCQLPLDVAQVHFQLLHVVKFVLKVSLGV